MRIDHYLVEKKLVRSRSQALDIIKRKELKIFDVTAQTWNVVDKASYKIDPEFNIKKIKIESELISHVSRAGLKLKKALDLKAISVKGLNCLDVGQSTGGFSEVLHQEGALKVVGVEVGQNQISKEIKSIKTIYTFEKLDIRAAKENSEFSKHLFFDFVVVDVSFISLTQVIDSLVSCLVSNAQILALVKPQFELSAKDLDAKGVVKNKTLIEKVKLKMRDMVETRPNLELLDFFETALKGKEGNTEFFLWLRCKST